MIISMPPGSLYYKIKVADKYREHSILHPYANADIPNGVSLCRIFSCIGYQAAMISGSQSIQGLPTLCMLQGVRDQLVRYSSHTRGKGEWALEIQGKGFFYFRGS